MGAKAIPESDENSSPSRRKILFTFSLYAGQQGTYSGLDQLNVVIPFKLAGSGSVGVQVQIDGQVTNTVTIRIK